MMKQINIAYQVLSDLDKKIAYDDWLNSQEDSNSEPSQKTEKKSTNSTHNNSQDFIEKFIDVFLNALFRNKKRSIYLLILIFIAILSNYNSGKPPSHEGIQNQTQKNIIDPFSKKEGTKEIIDPFKNQDDSVNKISGKNDYLLKDQDAGNETQLRFDKNYNEGGMLGVTADIKKCYKESSVLDIKSIQMCMLYDSYAYFLDVGYRQNNNTPSVTDFLTDKAYSDRMNFYTELAFKSSTSDYVKNLLKIKINKIFEKMVDNIRIKTMSELSEEEYSNSFRCPETYKTEAEKRDNILDSIAWLKTHKNQFTPDTLVEFRLQLLQSHHCDVTLDNIEKSTH
jgi:curved DNA-binding protein CbpA